MLFEISYACAGAKERKMSLKPKETHIEFGFCFIKKRRLQMLTQNKNTYEKWHTSPNALNGDAEAGFSIEPASVHRNGTLNVDWKKKTTGD